MRSLHPVSVGTVTGPLPNKGKWQVQGRLGRQQVEFKFLPLELVTSGNLFDFSGPV